MDPRNFDRIARVIGAGTSRRDAIKTLAGGAMAAVAAFLGRDEASAAARKRDFGQICSKGADCLSGTCSPKDATGRRRCDCPAPLVACNGGCVDPLNDPNNCGGCGQLCRAVEGQPAACSAGTCTCVDCPSSSDCICISDIDGRLLCVGVAFIYAGGSLCAADADCPDPDLPSTFPPYAIRCVQGNICAAITACGANVP